jgi:hypothetical protein
MWGTFRIATGAYTRNPKERPKTLPLIALINGQPTEIDCPIDSYPFVDIILPKFDVANLLKENTPRTQHFVVKFLILSAHIPRQKPPIPGVFQYQRPNPSPFEVTPFTKLLAKIAHGFAVGELGYEKYKWLLPEHILSDGGLLYDYVGGVTSLNPSDPPHEFLGKPGVAALIKGHTLKYEYVRIANGFTYLTVVIGLFLDEAPKYRVVVAQAWP